MTGTREDLPGVEHLESTGRPTDCSVHDTQYLRFEEVTSGAHLRKTKIVNVLAARDGTWLGTIRWFGRWRQYALHPHPETVWNPDCLDAVNACVRALMAERRA